MSLMKKRNLSLSNFLIIFFFINFSISNSEDLNFIYGKAIVIDGDTIKINGEKIRFGGIDAPEKEQICYLNGKKFFCGKISAQKLKEIIGKNNVKCIKEKNRDRYRRIIAECFVNGNSISKNMVKSGHAFDYAKYSKNKYSKYQEYAKKNKLGLWKMKFEYPWLWRKKNK